MCVLRALVVAAGYGTENHFVSTALAYLCHLDLRCGLLHKWDALDSLRNHCTLELDSWCLGQVRMPVHVINKLSGEFPMLMNRKQASMWILKPGGECSLLGPSLPNPTGSCSYHIALLKPVMPDPIREVCQQGLRWSLGVFLLTSRVLPIPSTPGITLESKGHLKKKDLDSKTFPCSNNCDMHSFILNNS